MSYQNILVPVAGSKNSFSAVKHAVEIAKVFDNRLTLISLVSEDPSTDADFYYQMERKAPSLMVGDISDHRKVLMWCLLLLNILFGNF